MESLKQKLYYKIYYRPIRLLFSQPCACRYTKTIRNRFSIKPGIYRLSGGRKVRLSVRVDLIQPVE